MAMDHLTDEAAGALEFDDLLRDLDAILDASFLGEVKPSLDEAERARRADDEAA